MTNYFILKRGKIYQEIVDKLLIGSDYEGTPYDYFPENPITFKFWVTGLFEDELLPPTGDLNLDGEINVVDVVVLVNSILGIG